MSGVDITSDAVSNRSRPLASRGFISGTCSDETMVVSNRSRPLASRGGTDIGELRTLVKSVSNRSRPLASRGNMAKYRLRKSDELFPIDRVP